MALEQSNLPANSIDGDNDGAHNGVYAPPTSTDIGDESSKTPRLPRWTRQEILVLIQGKRVAESKTRSRIRTGGTRIGSGQAEPKWAAISSYCRMHGQHGVNRGPVQCRKRWSNLAGDFEKIKEWESKDASESFWVMRNDLKRERKLPGFFDKEVYAILESGSGTDPNAIVADSELTPRIVKEEKEDTEEIQIAFGTRGDVMSDEGLCYDFEQDESGRSPVKEADAKGVHANAIHATPISVVRGYQAQGSQGNENEKQPSVDPHDHEIGSASQEMRKRQRLSDDGDHEEDTSLQNGLIDVLERNGTVLAAHIEAQNTHFQLDREQRKEQADSLVAVLNKLTDALVRIAEKL